LQSLISNLVSLFAVAGLVGICAGILWIVLVKKVFTEHESSMITVAYLLLVFVVTEYLNGNGAIAGLFLGLMLKNARRLTGIFSDITRKNPEPVKAVAVKKASANAVGARKAKNGKKDAATGEQPATPVTTPKEEFFYHQVSFILKTFFFVYIGSLINIYDTRAIVISVLIAVALMVIRVFSSFLLFSFRPFEKQWITSFFARGLAAAAIAQILLLEGIDDAATIANISYGVICFTIILSSLRVFTVKRHALKLQEEAAGASGEK
ncbi:TPA: hypothetical protein HA270_00880, partial [Candidatus Woesearchaeota archaeon]|nr:hypothetical protein [Candidatus Woesearchaeota archaeon]